MWRQLSPTAADTDLDLGTWSTCSSSNHFRASTYILELEIYDIRCPIAPPKSFNLSLVCLPPQPAGWWMVRAFGMRLLDCDRVSAWVRRSSHPPYLLNMKEWLCRGGNIITRMHVLLVVERLIADQSLRYRYVNKRLICPAPFMNSGSQELPKCLLSLLFYLFNDNLKAFV